MDSYQSPAKIAGKNPRIELASWSWLLGAVLFFLFAGTPAMAQEDAESGEGPKAQSDSADVPKVTMGMVRKQLRLLDSASLKERDDAEKALTEMGAGVLPFLPQVDAQTSGEMKIRLERIRQAMTYKATEKFFEASIVSLEGEMSLEGAIAQLEEQSENTIELQGIDPTEEIKVKLSLKEVPFWNAVSELMDQANLRINSFGTTVGDLVLTRGASAKGFIDGPFRVEPLSVQSRIQAASPDEGQLDVSFQFAWEPRLKPIFMRVPMESVKATVGDAEFQSANPRAAPEVSLDLGTCTAQVDLRLQKPDRGSDKLDALEGVLYVAIPSERYQYKFEKFANGAQQSEKKGDVKVTLQGARKNGPVYEMRVFTEFGDAKGGFESYRSWMMSNEAYLLDKNGKRLEKSGWQTYARTQNGIGVGYLFQINDDANSYTLVYESPVSIDEQQVRYRIEDIPLP